MPWLVSQAALVVKNSPANAGDIRDSVLILDQEDAMEGGMATHFSIFVWKNPMDRGAWHHMSLEDRCEDVAICSYPER